MNNKSFGRLLKSATALSFLFVLIAGVIKVHAAFPGANGKIVFYSNRDGNWEVYTMNSNGSGQTNITNNPSSDGDPRWSPDGTKISFTSDRDNANGEIYVMNADGSGLTRLTNNTDIEGAASWSPDGTKIVFDSQRDGNPEIYVMNADGSDQTRLTNNPAEDNYPAWSPDGTKVAFTSNRNGDYEIFLMNADGTGQSDLTNFTGANESSANWSPDGTKIAFVSNRDGILEVYKMDSDGNNQINLSNNPASDAEPAWSPDGTKILFSSNRDNPNSVFIMNADGTGQTNLTNNLNSFADLGGDWQPKPIFNFSGFFQPVDNIPTLNLVKAGQAVPVKFSLNGDRGLDIFAAGSPTSQKIDCDSSAVLDNIEETLTAGSSSLSYDPATDTYDYVWKTDKSWINTCRQLIVKLSDETSHRANFKFK